MLILDDVHLLEGTLRDFFTVAIDRRESVYPEMLRRIATCCPYYTIADDLLNDVDTPRPPEMLVFPDSAELATEIRGVLDAHFVDAAPSGLETTEYRAIKLRCLECGHVTKARFPEWAKAPVQYGARMNATASYLAVHQYMPYERMVEHVRDAYGAKVSAGTLVAMVSRAGQRVLPGRGRDQGSAAKGGGGERGRDRVPRRGQVEVGTRGGDRPTDAAGSR